MSDVEDPMRFRAIMVLAVVVASGCANPRPTSTPFAATVPPPIATEQSDAPHWRVDVVNGYSDAL